MAHRLHDRHSGGSVVLADSITEVLGIDAGRVVVTGSHGGVSAAFFAGQVRAALYVFNDAGVGKDAAGVAGLAMLDRDGIAACAVAHTSARIGEALDALESGVVSAVNTACARRGVRIGMTAAAAVALFAG